MFVKSTKFMDIGSRENKQMKVLHHIEEILERASSVHREACMSDLFFEEKNKRNAKVSIKYVLLKSTH